MIKHYILFISCLLFSAFTLHAQIAQLNPKIVTVRQYEKEANKAFESRDYNSALEYYLIILKDEPKREDLFWNTAESARQTRHYTVAYQYFESLNQTALAKDYPLLNFKRAMVKKSLGDYDGALALFKSFIGTVPVASAGANDFIKEAQAEIEACEWAKPIAESTPTYTLVHLDDYVNTNYTDIAPMEYKNTLYYTSAYFDQPTAQPVTRMYKLNEKGKSELLDINSDIKGDYTAHFTLNTEGSRVYYNIGKMLTKTEFHAEIYYRDKDENGKWKAPVRLPDTINTQMYTATQPNIGFDKATGREILYFVSDRPGGKGGLDIWYSEIDAQGNFGIPKNLSDVNTEKDDITPFHFNKAQILFFSTEGYKTMGGFDVFFANKKENGSWSTPSSAGFPLNSSYDETYYSISGENGRSYFVSNRKGGNCISPDKDCVCNDIYNFDIKLDLKAETFLVTTGEALKGCQVELLTVETGERKSSLNKENNNYDFPLELNKNYRLIATKENHIPDTVYFNTNDIWQTTTLYKKLNLKPNLKLIVHVFDKISMARINGAQVDMREANTGKLVLSEILQGNTLTTGKIEFGKSYWLYAGKDTYDSDSSFLAIDAYGTSDRYEYQDSLYLKAFKDLPLTLFFDDDHPNPRTFDSITSLTYDETYRGYVLKEKEYLRAYYGKNPNISFTNANEISRFFADSIKNNYKKLMDFSELLVKYMVSGKTLEIVIEGFASPLADAKYNKYLALRRIKSLINHFYEYENNALLPYINSRKLIIRVIPYGESKANESVSDDYNDKRNSVYSVAAMRERKVQIKDIKQLSDEEVKSLSLYDPRTNFNGYWNFDKHLSFLDQSLTPEASLENNNQMLMRSVPKTGTSLTVTPKSGATTDASKIKGIKQKHEYILVDAYTGKVISKETEVKAYDQTVNKNVDKAKRKSGNHRISLMSNKNYIVKGSARGYSEESITYYSGRTFEGNTEGGDVIKDTLFLTPFSGLPLPLYFNNDRPDPNTTKTISSESYQRTYKEYYGEKRQFVSQYIQLLAKNGSVPKAVNEMQTFFDNDVKMGFEQLTSYAAILKEYLKEGKKIDILIEGYASPLSNATYNEYLTSRRINSVIKYLTAYDGGALSNYIKNGQLKMRVKPLGESETAKQVSDDYNDQIRSVYSLEASKERRVVIKDIIIRHN